jgi:AbiV family abortive infection protein
MAKTMPVPDLRALGDFALAAARNARRLLGDADLLLAHGRWPSAYSLAVLAFEEAGKAWMCVTAMMVPDDVRPEWPYGELIARHADKLLAAHVMAHMLTCAIDGRHMIDGLADIGEDLEELAREHNQAKQRGFYADLLDGDVHEPSSVTKAEAGRMVATVRGLLDHGGLLSDAEFIAWLASQEPDALAAKDLVWGRFAVGLRQGGAEGMLASLRSLMDETGAAEGFPLMIREHAQHAVSAQGASPRRVQPRRLPRARRRARR